jgi:hypothetical protein
VIDMKREQPVGARHPSGGCCAGGCRWLVDPAVGLGRRLPASGLADLPPLP